MSDETTIAFELPLARAIATGSGEMLDRISVRDFIKDVEIGAFQSERGVSQRVRFNVVLEVSHSTAAQDDDVDKVLSYDTIVEAIEEQLSTERINLLETLAERIAERCLSDRRAIRVFVRIEKLDRIPGTLGVEIARARVDLAQSDNVVSSVDRAATPVPHSHPHQIVIFLPNTLLASDHLPAWLDAIDALETPAVIALDMLQSDLPASHPLVERRLRLLAIEQNAWVLAGRDVRCVVVSTRTEFDHAAKTGQLSVWAPSKIVLDAVSKPENDANHPRRLAHWFAAEIEATALVVIGGSEEPHESDVPVHIIAPDDPARLATLFD